MQISTNKRIEVIDITGKISEIVKQSSINEGICIIYTSHTTSAVFVNENESGLVSDIMDMLKKLIPPNAGYRHDTIDNNADSHMRAVLLGNSAIVPFKSSNLSLGTWQSIFL